MTGELRKRFTREASEAAFKAEAFAKNAHKAREAAEAAAKRGDHAEASKQARIANNSATWARDEEDVACACLKSDHPIAQAAIKSAAQAAADAEKAVASADEAMP